MTETTADIPYWIAPVPTEDDLPTPAPHPHAACHVEDCQTLMVSYVHLWNDTDARWEKIEFSRLTFKGEDLQELLLPFMAYLDRCGVLVDEPCYSPQTYIAEYEKERDA